MGLLERFRLRVLPSVNSVRGRLVLLTISLMVPALLSMGLLLVSVDIQGRRQLHQQMLTTARALSGSVERQAAVGVAVAETLATDQALLAGDWPAFHARAGRATTKRTGWVVVSDLDGRQILNTLAPYGSALPQSNRAPALTQAFREGRSQVSDLRDGTMAKRPVVTVGTPVVIRGQTYVLSYVVEAASFTSVFREQKVPERWVATVLDNNQKVIARSVRNEKWTGHAASADMTANLARSDEGVSRSRSLDGVPTMVAYTRSPRTGWTLVVAIPRAELARPALTSLTLGAGLFLLLLLLGLGLALFFSRGINRELGRLVAAAGTMGQGQPVVPPAGRGLEEIAAIHTALGDASQELQARGERQAVMINELNHRVKNTLATVQALARQTFGKMDGAPVAIFTDRLIALSAAHDLLTRTGWREADLGELVQVCLRAHGERIEAVGPAVSLDSHKAVALSMVFHELATNSAKYGALSASGGRVRIDWKIDPFTEQLHLAWAETGGPPVVAPGKPGFGTRLIDSSVRRELRGTPEFDFRPEGLVFKATLPLAGALRWANPV